MQGAEWLDHPQCQAGDGFTNLSEGIVMQYRNFTTFNVSVRRGAAWVTFLDAPLDPSGAIFLDEMSKLLDHLERDARIDAIVFQSRFPEVFSRLAGYKTLKGASSPQVGDDDSRKREFKRLLARIEDLPQTTIAKVEGMARYGGHELVMACDVRIAARGLARFVPMEVGLTGLLARGESYGHENRVGPVGGLSSLLGSRDYGADQAEYLGTIHRALDPEDVAAYVDDLVRRLTGQTTVTDERRDIDPASTPLHDSPREDAQTDYTGFALA